MSQAKKTLLSFLICSSLALSTHASVSSENDDYTSVGSSKPPIVQSSAPPIIVQAPPLMAQDTPKTSGSSSSQMADAKDLKLNDIYELKGFFKKGALEITPQNYQAISGYAELYGTPFKTYERGITLKGWKDSDNLNDLIKLLHRFNKLTNITCASNTLSSAMLTSFLSDAIQHYRNLEALELDEISFADKEVKGLLKVLPNPSSLRRLNIKASVLSTKTQSKIKERYPNAKVKIKEETKDALPKSEPKTIKETPIAKAEITIEKVEEQKAPVLKPLYAPSSTKAQTPAMTSGVSKALALAVKEEEKRASETSGMSKALALAVKEEEKHAYKLTIPLVAKGYEDIYQRFLKGALIYRPQEGSDVGMIKLPIAALSNPLEGTFDLSQCGDAGKYLAIATGYRKGKIAKNKDKIEIWLAPRFLIEQELKTTARHFQKIFNKWSETSPVGIFWTQGYYDGLWLYDYLTKENFDELSNDNLYIKWRKTHRIDIHGMNNQQRIAHSYFMFIL